MDADLDGRLGEVERGGQFTSSRPRDVILFAELSLQSRQLFTRERRPVATYLTLVQRQRLYNVFHNTCNDTTIRNKHRSNLAKSGIAESIRQVYPTPSFYSSFKRHLGLTVWLQCKCIFCWEFDPFSPWVTVCHWIPQAVWIKSGDSKWTVSESASASPSEGRREKSLRRLAVWLTEVKHWMMTSQPGENDPAQWYPALLLHLSACKAWRDTDKCPLRQKPSYTTRPLPSSYDFSVPYLSYAICGKRFAVYFHYFINFFISAMLWFMTF